MSVHVNSINEDGKTTACSSQIEHRRIHPKLRVAFKRKSRDDFITINVSGRRFQAEDAIFTKHPGIFSQIYPVLIVKTILFA